MSKQHTTGCLLCGRPIMYTHENKELSCAICGKPFEANAFCEAGHYVCDTCHSQKGVLNITAIALQSKSNNPVDIAMQMMDSPHVNMHGPEHHYMVPAALLTAYSNAGGKLDLEDALFQARERASQVPGGICGMWGACGAGIGAGIFISIVTGATPLSQNNWGLSNAATSQCLGAIAKIGGPRCCKRDSFLSLRTAAFFSNENLGTQMDTASPIVCHYFRKNRECLGLACPFFPTRKH